MPNVSEIERQDGEPCGCGHPDCPECNPRNPKSPEYQPNHASADRVLLLELAEAVKEMRARQSRSEWEAERALEDSVDDLLRRLGE